MLEVPGEEGFIITGVRDGGEEWADSDTLGERERKEVTFAKADGLSSPAKGRPTYSFISTFSSMLVFGFFFLTNG